MQADSPLSRIYSFVSESIDLPQPLPAGSRITINLPDDWHIHLRDAEALNTTVPHAAAQFARVMCMPNLVPPVKTAQDAIAYRERILAALARSQLDAESKARFNPRMTLYLTDHTSADDIKSAHASGIVQAVKLYPAGATTNSADGVTSLDHCDAALETMQALGIPLLLHGEVTQAEIDIFDREKVFIDDVLIPLRTRYPALKVVLEHITTADAAAYVKSCSDNTAATITPQHLLLNRNHMLVGGIKPHFYCLPILKREVHQRALLEAATSGDSRFFLGTDSAPHPTHLKESACGCAGCYSAPCAIQLYATAFDAIGKIDKLNDFASVFGAKFYGLPPNTARLTLIKSPMTITADYPYLDERRLQPLLAGETLPWSIAQ